MQIQYKKLENLRRIQSVYTEERVHAFNSQAETAQALAKNIDEATKIAAHQVQLFEGEYFEGLLQGIINGDALLTARKRREQLTIAQQETLEQKITAQKAATERAEHALKARKKLIKLQKKNDVLSNHATTEALRAQNNRENAEQEEVAELLWLRNKL